MTSVNNDLQALLRRMNGTAAPLSSEEPRRLLGEANVLPVIEATAQADLLEESAQAVLLVNSEVPPAVEDPAQADLERAAQTDEPKEQTALADVRAQRHGGDDEGNVTTSTPFEPLIRTWAEIAWVTPESSIFDLVAPTPVAALVERVRADESPQQRLLRRRVADAHVGAVWRSPTPPRPRPLNRRGADAHEAPD
jgi:hypothetical protein